MGGSWFEEDWEFVLPRTLVLVGKNGSGKSATGNSILDMQIFQSNTTSELQTTALIDGRTLNVIDTPGLFDYSLDSEFIKKEIVSCIDMSRVGIDAFLVVISIRSGFSEDEKAAISRLINLFGRKIYDYMIIVFTGGDELEDDEKSFGDFLRDSHKALQETLHLCGNRCVLFDNKTNDPTKRSNQVQKLLFLANIVLENNGGKRYTNEYYTEWKFELKLKETTLMYEKLLSEERTALLKVKEDVKIAQKKSDSEIQKFELKLKETTLKFEQLLTKERTARLKAEENAKIAQKKLDREIQKVESKLKGTNRKFEQLLAQERAAWVKTKTDAKVAQNTLDMEMEIRKMTERLHKAKQKEEELRWPHPFVDPYWRVSVDQASMC